jgi:hypothetical protein
MPALKAPDQIQNTNLTMTDIMTEAGVHAIEDRKQQQGEQETMHEPSDQDY